MGGLSRVGIRLWAWSPSSETEIHRQSVRLPRVRVFRAAGRAIERQEARFLRLALQQVVGEAELLERIHKSVDFTWPRDGLTA